MILTDSQILTRIDDGRIVIQPFHRDQLGTNSYDVRIGYKLLTYTNHLLDPRKENPTTEIIIPEDGMYLQPQKLYLASTIEWTETNDCVPVIEGKSSLGRLGLFIHITAGFGDVGFKGNWTLELMAVQPIKIYPNMKIAQISYHLPLGTPIFRYDQKDDAKYSEQSGVTASKYYQNFENEGV
jgi:dCTP deaminase